MNKAIERWKASIETMEEFWYDKSDEDDLVMDIVCRQDINDNSLPPDEKSVVQELDARFRAALYPALRNAGLVELYKRYGSERPASQWWWHVEE